ncbi:MAG: FAD-dependent oxidoreductase [Halolamina sp.]
MIVALRADQGSVNRVRALDAAGDIEFTPCPYVWLAREGDDTTAEAIREQVPQMRSHDRDVDLLDAADLAERFPVLETDDVAVAAVANDAGYLDTESYVVTTAKRALGAGATIRTRTEAAIETRNEASRSTRSATCSRSIWCSWQREHTRSDFWPTPGSRS